MNEYRPLKDLEIFLNKSDDSFIVAKHTSAYNVKVSFMYSSVYVYVSNNQSSDYHSPKRARTYIEHLIEKYEQLRDAKHDDDIDWRAIHQETINTLEELRAADWYRLGFSGVAS